MKKLNALMICVLLAACGGDSGSGNDGGNANADARVTGPNDVEPMLISGGGVSSGAVHGEINVHAIDDESGAAISGATVRVGDAGAGALENQTDGSGLAVFIDESLIGPQMVTVSANGYAAATWIGVNGANVTVTLAKNPRTPVPMASVSGSISLPAPGGLGEKYTLAIVLYSWSPTYGARENSIPQPMNGDTPANFCIRTILDGASCNWQMNTRVGKQIHYAVIVEGDTEGTTDDVTDDTYEILGYSVQPAVTLSAGQSLTGVTLSLTTLPTTDVSVQFPSAPAGAGDMLAFPFIDAGDAGQLVFPLPTLSPGATTTKVPSLVGAFAGMSYQLVGLAVANQDSARPYSVSFARSVTFSGSETLNSFLPLPSAVTNSGDTYSFTGAPGAATHFVTLADASDNPAWTVLILDGSTSFTLPALTPDPRAGRSLEVRVTGADLSGFNPSNFAIPSFADQMARASEATN